MERVHIVGVITNYNEDDPAEWDIVGIEPLYEQALQLCTTKDHFILTFVEGQTLAEGWLDMDFPNQDEDEFDEDELDIEDMIDVDEFTQD